MPDLSNPGPRPSGKPMRSNLHDALAEVLKDANLTIQYRRAYPPVCTCYQTDPKYWTRYGSAVEPGSQWELNPACYVHNAAEAPYYNDPLDTTIPVPWSAIVVCDCPEMAEHRSECLHSTIFGWVVSEQDFDPRWIWPTDWWGWRQNWRCQGADHGHVLGEINGPTHWCEREGRVVGLGE